MTTECSIVARAVHFGACLLFFGSFAFELFVAAPILARGGFESAAVGRWRSHRLSLILLPIVLLSGLAWFALVAKTMIGAPWSEALQPGILKTVWSQTQFGVVWKLRSVFLSMAAAVAAVSFVRRSNLPLQRVLAWIQLALGALLLGSLAWAGHGQEDSPWHLFADILHLLVAGLWPTGLLPLVLLLRKLRRASEPGRWEMTATLVRRFSALSLGSVALLVLTGWVNAWYLVGSPANLLSEPYGRWLLAKIAMFGGAVAIGTMNLLKLKPRLACERLPSAVVEATSLRLRRNVEWELILGMAIVGAVAVLGILPPAAH
jgi:putative copper resistance protein D